MIGTFAWSAMAYTDYVDHGGITRWWVAPPSPFAYWSVTPRITACAQKD
jgi:hypothetical protein